MRLMFFRLCVRAPRTSILSIYHFPDDLILNNRKKTIITYLWLNGYTVFPIRHISNRGVVGCSQLRRSHTFVAAPAIRLPSHSLNYLE